MKAGRFPYSPGQEPTSRKCRVFALGMHLVYYLSTYDYALGQ